MFFYLSLTVTSAPAPLQHVPEALDLLGTWHGSAREQGRAQKELLQTKWEGEALVSHFQRQIQPQLLILQFRLVVRVIWGSDGIEKTSLTQSYQIRWFIASSLVQSNKGFKVFPTPIKDLVNQLTKLSWLKIPSIGIQGHHVSSIWGSISHLDDVQLEQLLFCLTGLGPKVSVKDLLVSSKTELQLGLDLWWVPLWECAGVYIIPGWNWVSSDTS